MAHKCDPRLKEFPITVKFGSDCREIPVKKVERVEKLVQLLKGAFADEAVSVTKESVIFVPYSVCFLLGPTSCPDSAAIRIMYAHTK